jgi:hypothetical protein
MSNFILNLLCFSILVFLTSCDNFQKNNKEYSKKNENTDKQEFEKPRLEKIKPDNLNLKTIYSIGGKGKNVDYRGYDLNHLFELTDKGPFGDSYFINGCDGGSILCKATGASSTLSSNTGKYNIKNLVDYNPLTAWVEGEKGYGIGSFFELYCNNLNTIYNGYQNSPTNWLKNSRVKKFKVYIDGKPLCFLILKDEMGEQNFELPFDANWDTGHIFKFEIVDVYQGSLFEDVCISEIGVQGCCFASNSLLKTSKGNLSLDESNDSILTYDYQTKELKPTLIEKKVIKVKSQLYKVTLNSNVIYVTREHRFKIKDNQNLSMMEMLSKWKFRSYKDLCNRPDIKIGVLENDSIVYYAINRIERINGYFETVSIRKLSKGISYIVNGFIQETEDARNIR